MFLPTNITLKLGDAGDFVTELQRRLSIVKCFNGGAINGVFDGAVVNGVSRFQAMVGIRADGIAGPETLRRLNGSLSGDTSSSAPDNAAEEAKRQEQIRLEEYRQAQLREQEVLAEQQRQQVLAAQQQTPSPLTPLQQAFAAPAQVAAPTPVQTVPPIDQSVYTTQQQTLQQQIQREMQQQAQNQPMPSANDILAQMLLTQGQPPHALVPQQSAPVQHQPAPVASMAPLQQPPIPVQQSAPVHTAAPVSIQAQQAAPVHQAAPLHQAAPAAYATAPIAQAAAPVAAAAEPTRGIVARTMQYANEMVQKLANYFEAKLPAPVLQEVKEIGHTMARSGIRESAIPTSPEQQQQRGGQELPSRGQQQGQQLH